MKPKNTICLWFNNDAHEAARFYAATFPNSEVTAVRKAPGDFPGGKEAIGVCVIEDIAQALLGILQQSRARSTEALITQAGEQLCTVMLKTNYEICALFSAFAAERTASPLLGQAVARFCELRSAPAWAASSFPSVVRSD